VIEVTVLISILIFHNIFFTKIAIFAIYSRKSKYMLFFQKIVKVAGIDKNVLCGENYVMVNS